MARHYFGASARISTAESSQSFTTADASGSEPPSPIYLRAMELKMKDEEKKKDHGSNHPPHDKEHGEGKDHPRPVPPHRSSATVA